jgi:hypothetical protein
MTPKNMGIVRSTCTLHDPKTDYLSSDVDIDLPRDHNSDILLNTPSGKQVLLQWRIDGESLDICLPEIQKVHIWQADNQQDEVAADQLMVHLGNYKKESQ